MLKPFLLSGLLALCPSLAAAFEVKIAADGFAEDVASVSLSAQLARNTPGATSQDIVAAAQADYGRIVGVLYDQGYFAPVVSVRVDGTEAVDISTFQPPANIATVQISVQTGQRYRFGATQIAPLAIKTPLPDAFATDQIATTSTLRETLVASIDGWRAQGHAKAKLADQKITARHDRNQIDVEMRLDPGPQLRFGDLRLEGFDRMRPERIVEIAGLPKGQVFDPDDLDRAAQRLRRTGVFSVVSLSEAEQISAGNVIDIDAQLGEAKPRRFGFGAELSTLEGLGLSAFWLHRNLFGGGERLRLSGETNGIGGTTGGEDYELALTFNRPATFNEDTDFYALAEIASLNEPNFSSDRLLLEAGIRRYASERREYTFGVGVQRARSQDAFGAQSYTIVTLPASAEFDYRDIALNPTRGYYAKAEVTPFVNISGTANGVRTVLDARGYHTVGAAQRLTFAARAQLGSVAGPQLRDAPADFLFYSGGSGTVRGHDYQSLGVDLGGGNVVGGRSYLGLSGEVRVKTGDKLSVVGFWDAGYIGSEAFPDGSTGQWQSGAGLGIRYDTGIGPVRLDVGVPISGPGKTSGFELYIGIGQAF